MRSTARRLEPAPDDGSLLLLYAAGELADPRRREVEGRLQAEPALRRQWAALQAAQDQWRSGMAALDAASPAGWCDSARRRALRDLRQVFLRRAEALLREPAAGRQLPLPWWAYPVSAAAVVLVAFLVWWGYSGGVPGPTNLQGQVEYRAPWGGGYWGRRGNERWYGGRGEFSHRVSLGLGLVDDVTDDEQLRSAEQEMMELRGQADVWSLFEGETR